MNSKLFLNIVFGDNCSFEIWIFIHWFIPAKFQDYLQKLEKILGIVAVVIWYVMHFNDIP